MSQFSDPNPYSSSTIKSQRPNLDTSNPAPTTQFTVIGILLVIFSTLGFIMGVLSTIGNGMDVVQGGPTEVGKLEGSERTGFYVGYYGVFFGLLFSLVLQPLIFWAGINFIRGRGRTMMWIGSILATIPLLSPCCIAGIPVGIWALVLLSTKPNPNAP